MGVDISCSVGVASWAGVSEASTKTDNAEDLSFDWENMEYRKKRFTVHTSSLSDWVLSKEGDKLYYITRFEGRNDLWVTDLRERDAKL